MDRNEAIAKWKRVRDYTNEAASLPRCPDARPGRIAEQRANR